MTAPRLTQALLLETPTRESDGAGGFTEGWQALGTLWAELRPRSGRDAKSPAGTVAKAGWRISVRAAPEGSSARPRPGQRLRHGARLFRILSVALRDPQGRFLTCTCEEETAP